MTESSLLSSELYFYKNHLFVLIDLLHHRRHKKKLETMKEKKQEVASVFVALWLTHFHS